MTEKIKNFDFINASEADVAVLIDELVALPKEKIKEHVNEIVDTIDYKYTSDESTDKLPHAYEMIFANDTVKNILEELLEEYDQKV